MNPIRLSVAVPVHNEERNIPKLLKRIGGVLDGLAGGPHQILIVDDEAGTAHLNFSRLPQKRTRV